MCAQFVYVVIIFLYLLQFCHLLLQVHSGCVLFLPSRKHTTWNYTETNAHNNSTSLIKLQTVSIYFWHLYQDTAAAASNTYTDIQSTTTEPVKSVKFLPHRDFKSLRFLTAQPEFFHWFPEFTLSNLQSHTCCTWQLTTFYITVYWTFLSIIFDVRITEAEITVSYHTVRERVFTVTTFWPVNLCCSQIPPWLPDWPTLLLSPLGLLSMCYIRRDHPVCM